MKPQNLEKKTKTLNTGVFGQTVAKVGAMGQGGGSVGGKHSCDPFGLEVQSCPRWHGNSSSFDPGISLAASLVSSGSQLPSPSVFSNLVQI